MQLQSKAPVKVIQFGEGGFLRGFFDWMLKKINLCTDFGGSVAVVQPIKEGLCRLIEERGGVYTHLTRDSSGVESLVIDVIDRCVNSYLDFDAFLALAEIPTARFIVSNTTEAGIVFNPADEISMGAEVSFPGKLTRLLLRRYELGLPGFIILPCELIESNGDALREAVLKYSELWNLGEGFRSFVLEKNVFANTLVDRINTGFPKGEDTGIDDPLLNASEKFHLWVIETEADVEKEIPFGAAGLNVVITTDKLYEYRTRKVRILNGAHTSLVAHGLLSGFDTVKSCMDSEQMREFLRGCIFDEIIPTLDLDKDELIKYAEDVLLRFANPYINHYLSSISLNSVSKFKVRVLPSILEYRRRFGKNPENLIFAFARLIEFYKAGEPKDLPEVMEFMKKESIGQILKNKDLWGVDLTDLEEAVENAYRSKG